MSIFLLVLLLGLIPAAIAQNKGRSFFVWWIYGAALLIVALPHSIFMKTDHAAKEQREISDDGKRKCPHCAELIKPAAKVCKHCGRDVTPEAIRNCAGCGALIGSTYTERCMECGKPTAA